MATHDRYDNDILKQLTRIANSLEKIANDRQFRRITVDGSDISSDRNLLSIDEWEYIFKLLQKHAAERATMCDTDDIPCWLDEEKEVILNNINYAKWEDQSEYSKQHPDFLDKIINLAKKPVEKTDNTRGTGLWQPGDED